MRRRFTLGMKMMDRIRNEHIRGKAQGQNGEEGEMMVIFKRRLLKFELLGKRGEKRRHKRFVDVVRADSQVLDM